MRVRPGGVFWGAGVTSACLASSTSTRSPILFAAYTGGWLLDKPGLQVFVVIPDTDEPWKRATVPFATSVVSWSSVMLAATTQLRRTSSGTDHCARARRRCHGNRLPSRRSGRGTRCGQGCGGRCRGGSRRLACLRTPTQARMSINRPSTRGASVRRPSCSYSLVTQAHRSATRRAVSSLQVGVDVHVVVVDGREHRHLVQQRADRGRTAVSIRCTPPAPRPHP